jgi:hypothetical protein
MEPPYFLKRSVFTISNLNDSGGEENTSISRVRDLQEVLPGLFYKAPIIPKPSHPKGESASRPLFDFGD